MYRGVRRVRRGAGVAGGALSDTVAVSVANLHPVVRHGSETQPTHDTNRHKSYHAKRVRRQGKAVRCGMAAVALSRAIARLVREDIAAGPWIGDRKYCLMACGEVTRESTHPRVPSSSLCLSAEEEEALKELHRTAGTENAEANACCFTLYVRLEHSVFLHSLRTYVKHCLNLNDVSMTRPWSRRGIFTAILQELETWLDCADCPFNVLLVSCLGPELQPVVSRRRGWFCPDDTWNQAVMSMQRPLNRFLPCPSPVCLHHIVVPSMSALGV
jgi:hypothetical protein